MGKLRDNLLNHNWDSFVHRAFFAVLSGVLVFSAQKISAMSDSIVDLNTKLAVLIYEVSEQKDILTVHTKVLAYHQEKIEEIRHMLRVQ